jgi:hypothetical protein
MGASEDYRHHAAECLRVAERTTDLTARVALLDMARAWHSLADQADRNSRADLVYETPPAPRAEQQPLAVQQQQQQQQQPAKEHKED